MDNLRQLPNGLNTRQANAFFFVSEASVRHTKRQKAQLADIRAGEPPQSPAALMTKGKYLQLGSGENINKHRVQMAETREMINAACLGMEVLEKSSQISPAVDAPPRSSFSILRRVLSASKRAVNQGVLSLPTDRDPDMASAMQTPHSGAERKNKKTQGSPKDLLDENKFNARSGMQHLANARHLLQRANQNHEVVTYRRAQRREVLQDNAPRLIELVKKHEALLAKRHGSAPSQPLGLPESGLESDIDARLDANAAAIAELLNQVTPSDQVVGHLPALMNAVAASDKNDALTRALNDLLPLNQDLIDDLDATEQDVENAEALVERVATYTDTQSEAANALHNKNCQDIIAALPGFRANPDDVLQRADLSKQLGVLFERLQAQNAAAKDALDGAQVFPLAYQAIADTLSAGGGNADPARAVALLEHLLAPAHASGHFETVIGMVMGEPDSNQLPATRERPAAIKDMDAVLQALAPLRRGMEVIHRITAEDGHAPNLQARGMAKRDQAAKIFLSAGKTRAEKEDAINSSTMQLLDAAQKGARKVFHGLDVDPAEGIGLAAARNRFTEAGTRTELQYVADRLKKFKDEWLPRAVERADSVTGSIGQGSHTGILALVDLLPTTGKTPVSEATLQLAAKTSTSYGIDPVKTGGQIDDYVKRSSQALQAAATALVRADPSTMGVLLQCAAAQIAQERMTAQQDQKIRPEHYTMAASDSAAIQERFLALARQAGVVTAGQEFQNLSNQIANPLPEHIAKPLKAESLFLWKTALQTQLTPRVSEADPARQATSEAVDMVRRLEDLMDTSSAPKITTQEDIYQYLATKIEQLQLRGKLRMSGGGVVGANVKPINWAMKAAEKLVHLTQQVATGGFGVSGGPRLRLDGQFGRNAVFEISMSTVGFEITIASEKKVSLAAGVGASASVGAALAKGSVLADKSLVGDRNLQQGVKFMIPRSANKEYTDDAMRLEARKLFDLIFQMQMAEDGQVEHMNFDASSNNEKLTGIPNNLAQIFAECPHVSVAMIDDMSDRSRKQETGLNISVKGTPLFDSIRAGATIGGGVKNTHLDSRAFNVSEKTGYHNVERHNHAAGGQIAITGGAGVTANVWTEEGAAVDHTISISLPGVSVSHQVKQADKDAKLRLVSIDGKTDAVNTRRDVEHSSVTSLEQSIRPNWESWVRLGVVELFNTSGYKKYTDAPLAEKRRVVEEHLNNTIRELEEKDHEEDGRRVLRNVFAESYRLVDSAAAQYDSLRDAQTQAEARLNKLRTELKTVRNGPFKRSTAQKTALKAAILEAVTECENFLHMQNALLLHDASWTPWKLTASERTLESQQRGVDFVIQMGVNAVAEGQRPMKSWPA